ncbi:MAG: hypothetical protein ACREBH_01925 [Candidatus Micrarchaeaceae archaeon]
MEHDIKFYIVVGILAVTALASVLTLNIIVILAGLLISSIMVVVYKLDYIIGAVIFRHTNLIQMVDGCELSGERLTAVRRVGGRFCATAAALLKNRPNDRFDRDKIENVISNAHCAFKFVMQVEHVDINKLLDRLRTRRSMKEIEIGKLNSSESRNSTAKLANLKRQVDHIDHEIESISSGEAPLMVSQYIVTSAISDNMLGAQERAKSQLRELVSEFGALLGTESEVLQGNDLLDIMRFDSMVIA